jgi:hypothetical protein
VLGFGEFLGGGFGVVLALEGVGLGAEEAGGFGAGPGRLGLEKLDLGRNRNSGIKMLNQEET